MTIDAAIYLSLSRLIKPSIQPRNRQYAFILGGEIIQLKEKQNDDSFIVTCCGFLF
jgi:hypothetical protein